MGTQESVTFRLSEELKKRIERLCEIDDRTLSNEIRLLVEKGLEEREWELEVVALAT